ncbi:outer membrane beta-barrel protein [Microbulbifer sp. JMSA004]|uniref:outer membrane beta-barrel protein n=1 Tax=Microbulbifer sp. JMSA004 TaxID=3243370 RepID=UPI004039B29B
MKISRWFLLLPALTISSFSMAVEKPFYLGIGTGNYAFDGQKDLPDYYQAGEQFTDHARSTEIYVGYQFHKYFSVEAEYNHFNETYSTYATSVTYITDDETINADNIQINSVVQYPVLESLTLNALLGISYTRVDSVYRPKSSWLHDGPLSPIDESKDNSFDLTYGIGATYNFTDSFSSRLQWTRIDNDIVRISGASLSLEVRF